MVARGAVLALVLLVVSACSGGQTGTVMLAPTAGAQPASEVAVRTPPVRSTPSSPTAAGRATVVGTGWYTSAAGNAKYYYCEADRVEIAEKNRRSYLTEQALLADWSGKRTKWPQSKC